MLIPYGAKHYTTLLQACSLPLVGEGSSSDSFRQGGCPHDPCGARPRWGCSWYGDQMTTDRQPERYSVLVVDDDAAMLETTVAVLGADHDVTATPFPRAALGLVHRREFHV